MKRIKYCIKLYPCYVRMGFLRLTQYPLDAALTIISLIIREVSTFIGLLLIANVTGGIGSWSLYELCLLFGMGAMIEAVSQSFFDMVWSIGGAVRKGEFDIFMIRPAPIFLQLIGQRIHIHAFFSFFAASGLVVYSMIKLRIPVSLENMLFIIEFLIFGTMINTSVYLIFNSFNFWIIQGNQIAVLIQTMREFCKYPLQVFPMMVKVTFTFFVPFGFVGYYPAAYLTGKEGSFVTLLMPVIGIAACVCGGALWRKGIGSYNSTGT